MIRIGFKINNQLVLPVKPLENYIYILKMDGVLNGFNSLADLRIKLLSNAKLSSVNYNDTSFEVGLFDVTIINNSTIHWLFKHSNGSEKPISGEWKLLNGNSFFDEDFVKDLNPAINGKLNPLNVKAPTKCSLPPAKPKNKL